MIVLVYNHLLLPLFSEEKCLNLTGGASPFGSSAGNTRVPIVGLPDRFNTGGTGDVAVSYTAPASFCSSLLDRENNEDFVCESS